MPDKPLLNIGALESRLNWLRAGVLGANDGIISVAGIVIGVASATGHPQSIAIAGLAGLVAGALSMAGGEYVSVSSQRDTESTLLERERRQLREDPQAAEDELTASLQAKGISPETARTAARELSAKDPLRAHSEAELGLDPEHLINPWHAAGASFVAFTCGALLPLLAITLLPDKIRIAGCAIAVVIALAITGYSSAHLGGAPRLPAMRRTVSVGVATMLATYLVGRLFGVVTG